MNILSIDTSGDSSSISSKIGDDLLSFQISHQRKDRPDWENPVSYTHLRAHETTLHLVCRLLLEKKKK